jgi:hypothetical protein
MLSSFPSIIIKVKGKAGDEQGIEGLNETDISIDHRSEGIGSIFLSWNFLQHLLGKTAWSEPLQT